MNMIQHYSILLKNLLYIFLSSILLSQESESVDDTLALDLDTIWDKMQSEKFVVRFKMPKNEELIHNDLVKGIVKFDLNLINDPIRPLTYEALL